MTILKYNMESINDMLHLLDPKADDELKGGERRNTCKRIKSSITKKVEAKGAKTKNLVSANSTTW